MTGVLFPAQFSSGPRMQELHQNHLNICIDYKYCSCWSGAVWLKDWTRIPLFLKKKNEKRKKMFFWFWRIVFCFLSCVKYLLQSWCIFLDTARAIWKGMKAIMVSMGVSAVSNISFFFWIKVVLQTGRIDFFLVLDRCLIACSVAEKKMYAKLSLEKS